MGIPKFYRWLSERYPLINQPGGTTVIPIIDNFYLDMNGIIHNCTHGNNPDVKLTEEEMILRIFTYLDKLFHIVKPQKLIFMAIDGVAPRAKMNQQRARRFKSAQAAEEAAEAARRRGEVVPEDRFDSNCITPGTGFMGRLGAHLRFFIRKKVAEDKDWQKPKIVFSGHDVPGEGEHKIMEYIRWAKLEPGYAPNTRHCLYGLDADLIMLSLVTHEPHFCLLREVVSFTGGNRGQPAREVLDNPCQEHFVLLQIGLLRDYFELEFRNAALPFGFDLERVIDDFVLFCMLVGNDFLPALPTLDIAEGALDNMFSLYRKLLPQMGGYLTHAGELNRGRLELFLQHLASDEADVLQARAEDAEQFESKRARREGGAAPAWASARVEKKKAAEAAQNELDEDDAFEAEMAGLLIKEGKGELELLAEVEGLEDEEEEVVDHIISEPTMMGQHARNMFLNGDKQTGLAAWKERYYREKMGLTTEASRRRVVDSYIEGLHWVLEYYYRGVASWDWYYPYHYAPMASDLVNLASIHVEFHLGDPFLPFQQLLAVLPAASAKLLPAPYQTLMKDPLSPIVDFYPTEFRVDLEGKRADWEGIVLIPFLDEARLLRAAASVRPEHLSPEERERNRLGDILVFSYSPDSVEDSYCQSTLPGRHASVLRSCSRLVLKPPPPPLPADQRGFLPQIVEGTTRGITGPPGFPSLNTLKVGGEVRRAGVNVFGMASRKESLILQLKEVPGQQPSAQQVAGAVLGNRCWIKWPYLQEGMVEAVSDATCKVSEAQGALAHTKDEAGEWQQEKQRLVQEYATKQGVETGPVLLLLHVRPCEGLVRQVDGAIEKRFGKKEVLVPIQLVLRRNPSPDPRFQPDAAAAELAGREMEPGARALYLGRAHYGCLATVLPPLSAGMTKKGQKLEAAVPKGGPVRVSMEPAPTNAAAVAASAKRLLGNMRGSFVNSGLVARRLGVSSRTLGRMTGNVWLEVGRDKVDVGLCVKNAGKQLYVPDFAAPTGDGENKGWAYSEELIRCLQAYKQRFTWLWVAVEGDASSHAFQLEQVLPGVERAAAEQQVAELRKWLKGQPTARRPMVKFSAKVAPEQAVKMLQAALPPRPKLPAPVELENVALPLLLPPVERGTVTVALAGGTFEIGDRVAALSGSGTPPFGHRGTVVGVIDDALEVLFDAEFPGGADLYGRCHGSCGALLPAGELLNLSKPHAIKAEGAHAPRAVRHAASAPAVAPAAAQHQQQQRAGADPAKAALAAAAAALAGPGAPRPHAQPGVGNGAPAAKAAAAAMARAAAAASPARAPSPGLAGKGVVAQPRIPDESGARGFTMGRGKAPPAPAGVAIPQVKAPGAPPPNAGLQLLARLQSAGSIGPAPPAAAAALPSPLLQRPVPPAPPSPGQQLLSKLQQQAAPAPPQGIPPQPQVQARPPGVPPGPVAPMAPPPGLAPGSMLLQQLQGLPGGVAPAAAPPVAPPQSPISGQQLLASLRGGPAPPPPGPPSGLAPGPPPSPLRHIGSGKALLSALQQQPPAPAAVPLPPPPGLPVPAIPGPALAAGPPPAPGGSNAGVALLQRLRSSGSSQGLAAPPVPQLTVPQPPPPASGRGGDLSGLWQQLQQQHGGGGGAAARPPAAAPTVPVIAAPPPGALPRAPFPLPPPAMPVNGGLPASVPAPPAPPAAAGPQGAPAASDEAAFWNMLAGAPK